MGRKVYIKADDDTVLEKLRRGKLDDEVTEIAFDYPAISRDLSDAKEEELIDKLCEDLELLKTNTHIRELSIDDYLRSHNEKEDAKRVERAYVTLGEFLAANASIQSLDFHIDYLSDGACSAIAEGIRRNHSLNFLGFSDSACDVTPQGIDMLIKGIKDNHTIRDLHMSWRLAPALSRNDTLSLVYIRAGSYGSSKENDKALAEALQDNTTLREITIDIGNSGGNDDQIGREAGEILVKAIAGNSALRKLSLRGSRFGSKAAIALARVLADNKSVTGLSIHSKIGDQGAVALAEALQANRTITWLDLRRNKIGDEGIRAIAEVLKVNHVIAGVNLGWNKIANDGFKAIVETLKVHPTVTRLDAWIGIKSEYFSREGAKSLLEALKENNSLEELDLPNLAPNDEDAELIAKVLRKNTSLQALKVKDGTFGSKGSMAIFHAMKENRSLKTLDIHGCNLGIEGARALAEALRSNKTLVNLDIGSCRLTAEGVSAVAKALEGNSSLRSLSMAICNLEAHGCETLAQALRHNNTLRFLDIGYNTGIGSGGTKALAEALKVNCSLYSLDLSHCDLGDEGGIAIGEVLKSNTGLLALDLSDNRLRDRGMTAIAQALETNDALRILDISGSKGEGANRISDAGVRSLRKSLEANHTLAVLNIEDSYHSGSQYISRLVAELAVGLKKNRTLANLDMGFHSDEKLSPSDRKTLVDAAIASGSKNMICIAPYPGDEWEELSYRNEKAAKTLLEKIRKTPDDLTKEDLRNCKERIPAILYQVKGYESRIDAGVEEMAGILDTLKRRAEVIRRQTALQLRRASNDRVRHDLSHYAQDNGLTFEQMCGEIALYRTEQFRDPEQALSKMNG